jgi:large subunit ribosomal protein L37Ae
MKVRVAPFYSQESNMADEKLTSVKRFGTRYGRTLKLKFGQIEVEQRKKHKCPYCSNAAVKRQAVGIWECKKCGVKFTGKAYTIAKKQEQKAEEAKIADVSEEQAEEDYSEEQEA